MEFSRQEYWRGLPFGSLGHLPNPGMETWPPALQADSSPSEPPGKPNQGSFPPSISLDFYWLSPLIPPPGNKEDEWFNTFLHKFTTESSSEGCCLLMKRKIPASTGSRHPARPRGCEIPSLLWRIYVLCKVCLTVDFLSFFVFFFFN